MDHDINNSDSLLEIGPDQTAFLDGEGAQAQHDDGGESGSRIEKKSALEAAKRDVNCGVFGCNCKLKSSVLKSCRSLRCFLVVVSLTGLMHYLIAFGITYGVLTTLEKRFQLSSSQSGWIPSAFEISGMFFSLILSYALEKENKPLWIGIGSLVTTAAAVIFTIPHFTAEPYHVTFSNQSEETSAVCPTLNLSEFDDGCEEVSENLPLPNIYWWFIIGQVMMGIGMAPLCTLTNTYLDENLTPSAFGLYLGIYNAFWNSGPAVGFFLSAVSLNVYTDFLRQSDSTSSLSSNHPLWIGAWWLSFIISAVVLLILSFLIMVFPENPPEGVNLLEERRREAQKGSEYTKPKGFFKNIVDFPRAIWILVKNLPFVGLSLCQGTESFVLVGISVFLPKYFEAQFNMSPTEANIVVGFLSLSALMVGALACGILLQKLDPKFPGLMRMIMVCIVVSAVCSLTFIMHCPPVPFAGVSRSYSESCPISVENGLLLSPCNAHCDCQSQAFDPVCGVNNVMYYSACHAGCTGNSIEDAGSVIYNQCQCLSSFNCATKIQRNLATNLNFSLVTATSDDVTNGSDPYLDDLMAVSGRCATTCKYKWPYFVLIWPFLFFTSAFLVLAFPATMRCVSHSQRGFAIGVSIVVLSIGTSVAPIIYGNLIDRACTLWESSCTERQTCWLYDNRFFAYIMLGLSLAGKFLSMIFFSVAYLSYKPIGDDGTVVTKDGKEQEGEGDEEVMNEEEQRLDIEMSKLE